MYTYILIYIYIHTYIHTYIYIRTYTLLNSSFKATTPGVRATLLQGRLCFKAIQHTYEQIRFTIPQEEGHRSCVAWLVSICFNY